MNIALENKLVKYFERKNKLSRMELIGAIKKDYPSWTESTITVYMSKLKKDGKLGSPSRGMYTLSKKGAFQAEITISLKRLYSKIHKQYPYINFCVWDTRWLNSLMRHQPFRQYIIVEVEKDAAAEVFVSLNDSMRNVFLNPGADMFDHYISNIGDPIIVKQLVSEAPTEIEKKIRIPALEKLLVDMLIDKEIFAAQQGELEEIYASAFDRYEINIPKMKRYALRRNRENKVSKMINLISAK